MAHHLAVWWSGLVQFYSDVEASGCLHRHRQCPSVFLANASGDLVIINIEGVAQPKNSVVTVLAVRNQQHECRNRPCSRCAACGGWS